MTDQNEKASRGRDLNASARAWIRLGCRRLRPIPSVTPGRPLDRARVALISTGGAYLRDQEPFHTGKRGDPSFRAIPTDADPAELQWLHPHYDTTIAIEDVDAIFPIRLARALEAEGVIGSLAPTAVSMMGYIPLTRPLVEGTAPTIGELMQGESVDVALLCPAWPICNQSVGLVARELESRGIATVCLMLLREVAEKVKPPRSLVVPFGWGQPLGPPGEAELHRRVALEALQLVYSTIEPAALSLLTRWWCLRERLLLHRPEADWATGDP